MRTFLNAGRVRALLLICLLLLVFAPTANAYSVYEEADPVYYTFADAYRGYCLYIEPKGDSAFWIYSGTGYTFSNGVYSLVDPVGHYVDSSTNHSMLLNSLQGKYILRGYAVFRIGGADTGVAFRWGRGLYNDGEGHSWFEINVTGIRYGRTMTNVSPTISFAYQGFIPEGVTAPSSVNVTVGQKYTLPVPTAPGYTFNGWISSDATITGGVMTVTDKPILAMGTWSPRPDTKFSVELYKKN